MIYIPVYLYLCCQIHVTKATEWAVYKNCQSSLQEAWLCGVRDGSHMKVEAVANALPVSAQHTERSSAGFIYPRDKNRREIFNSTLENVCHSFFIGWNELVYCCRFVYKLFNGCGKFYSVKGASNVFSSCNRTEGRIVRGEHQEVEMLRPDMMLSRSWPAG